MSVICSCPGSTALTAIPKMDCGENFGQIQKLAFQRLSYLDSATSTIKKNCFRETAGAGTANSIKDVSSWQDFMTASDGKKIVVTPFVEAPTQDGGDAITFGGGNDTLGGAEEVVGRNASNMSFVLRKYKQSIIKILKALQCETNLGVYLFSEHNGIEAIREDLTETSGSETVTVTTYKPIPIRGFFVGDKVHGGLTDPDANTLQFSFLPNYSDDLEIVVPNFKPLEDL